jgi:hypothetical protein
LSSKLLDSQYLVYLRDKWNKNFSGGSRTIESSEKSRHINNENPIGKIIVKDSKDYLKQHLFA